jgi:hypothetical protein
MSKDQQSNSKRSAPEASETTQQGQKQAQIGCLLRICWVLIGNVALLALAAVISRQPPWSFSIADGAFFLIVVALIGIRYLDITRFEGTTANNEPATRATWVRYSVGLILLAAVIWIAVQSV